MKSNLKLGNHSSEPKFPALYQHREEKFVVLFVSTFEGTIVNCGLSDYYKLGYIGDWAECTDNDIWERLPSGSRIVLTQD